MCTFHHIAIVVENITESLDWYCEIYNGKPLLSIYIDTNQGVKVQFIQCATYKIELLEPLNDRSPVKQFLSLHGSGSIYHIAFAINDLVEQEKAIRKNGGIIVSKTAEAWGGMEVMFAVYFNKEEKQLVEYLKVNNVTP